MPYRFLPKSTQTALDSLNKYHEILDRFDIYLGGGTGLAFTLQYRVSYDLDFFTEKEFDPQILLSELKKYLDVSEVIIEYQTLKLKINNVRVSFFYYPYKLLEKFDTFNNVKLASLLDITLMKISSIGGRGLEKDFADLYYTSLKLGGLDWIIENFSKKFPEANFEHHIKSLAYFNDAKEGPRIDSIINDYNWDVIEAYFRKEIKSIITK